MMHIIPLLKLMTEKSASDLYLTVDAPPYIKLGGTASAIGSAKIKPENITEMLNAVINDKQRHEFEKNLELNSIIAVPDIGRFRLNAFKQRGEIGMVIRCIKGDIPDFDNLGLPPVLKSLIMELRGLILVVGSTGSGKSTTLASIIDYRNANHSGHILTIEDPIEYVYQHKKSIVDQREVGVDTISYENALKNAMRQAPDLILIGEILERDIMKHAIAYAQTGHLCLATLHANNANQALERVVNFFPEETKNQLLSDLALNLRAIVSLRLVPGIKKSRVPVAEILINSSYIADLILKGKIEEIKEVMARSREQGMQTFDQALYDLYSNGSITKENAIKFADSPNNVALQIRLHDNTGSSEGASNLSLTDD